MDAAIQTDTKFSTASAQYDTGTCTDTSTSMQLDDFDMRLRSTSEISESSAELTVKKYGPQFERFVRYAEAIGESYLPAESSTFEKWLVNDVARTVNVKGIDTYIRPINTAHREVLGVEPPALGDQIAAVLRGLKQSQYRLKPAVETKLWVTLEQVVRVMRTALQMPVDVRLKAQVTALRDATAVVVDFVHFSRGDTGVNIEPGDLVVKDAALYLRKQKLKGDVDAAARARREADRVTVLSLPAGAVPEVVQLVEKFSEVRMQLGMSAEPMRPARSFCRASRRSN